MSTLKEKFAAFEKRFDPSATADVDEVFQFDIEGTRFYLAITYGTCTLGEGEHDDPSVTLRMNAKTLQDLLSGETSGMQAYMSGQLKVEGNLMLATQLGNYFSLKGA